MTKIRQFSNQSKDLVEVQWVTTMKWWSTSQTWIDCWPIEHPIIVWCKELLKCTVRMKKITTTLSTRKRINRPLKTKIVNQTRLTTLPPQRIILLLITTPLQDTQISRQLLLQNNPPFQSSSCKNIHIHSWQARCLWESRNEIWTSGSIWCSVTKNWWILAEIRNRWIMSQGWAPNNRRDPTKMIPMCFCPKIGAAHNLIWTVIGLRLRVRPLKMMHLRLESSSHPHPKIDNIDQAELPSLSLNSRQHFSQRQ